MTRDDTHTIERDYHGYQLRVDNKGKFIAFDNNANKMAEANSLLALKDMLRKPTKVDLKGMTVGAPYYYEEAKLKTVFIYAVTGFGALLYQIGQEKKRAEVGDPIYIYDATRNAKREELRKARNRATAELDKLMKTWPKIDGKKLLVETNETADDRNSPALRKARGALIK
jgi:hypothetical protein